MSFFRTAHCVFYTDPNDVRVFPIITFIDGTTIDVYERKKLVVLLYILGIFNQST